MLQAHDYTAAFDRSMVWGIYLGCGLLVLAIMVWLTRRWQRDIRFLLLALLAVAMFLPAPIPGQGVSAPAFIFIGFGLLTGSVDAIAPVLVRFSLAGIATVLLVLVEAIWWRQRRRRRRVAAKPVGASSRRSAKS